MDHPDGSVWIEAEGQRDGLLALLEGCAPGPPLACVDQVERAEAAWLGFTDLRTRRFGECVRTIA